MDQWVYTFERMAEHHDTLSFQHKDNPQVVLQATRFTKTQTVDCLNVDIFRRKRTDYECGLCGRQISSDDADEAYNHFVQDHFNGHAVKPARLQ